MVEDTTTPDGSAFTIDQHGKVGIGIAPDATACLTLDTTGLRFGNGDTITSIYPEGAPSVPSGFNADTPSTIIRMTLNGIEYGVPAFYIA